MKFMMMISIVAVGTFSANAQYFKGRGRVYARPDIARDYLLSKYIETKWFYAVPMSRANLESPIVIKKLEGYHSSSQLRSGALAIPSIDKANRYHQEKPWHQNLPPLFDLAYSIYQSQNIPYRN